MKKIALISLLALLSTSIFSQNGSSYQTFVNHKSTVKINGFGGPLIDFSGTIDGSAILAGGGGAVLLNDHLFFGGFGYSALGGFKPDALTEEDGYKDYFEYGGVWIGYIFQPNKVFHPVLDLQAGWGNAAIEYLEEGTITNFTAYVIKPSVEIEMNVYRFMRVGLNVSYRHVSEIDMSTGTTASLYNFSGPGIGLSFKFGWFE